MRQQLRARTDISFAHAVVPLVQRTEKAYTLTLIHCSRGLCHVTASARFNAGQWASLKRLQLDMAGLIVCAALASDANGLVYPEAGQGSSEATSRVQARRRGGSRQLIPQNANVGPISALGTRAFGTTALPF